MLRRYTHLLLLTASIVFSSPGSACSQEVPQGIFAIEVDGEAGYFIPDMGGRLLIYLMGEYIPTLRGEVEALTSIVTRLDSSVTLLGLETVSLQREMAIVVRSESDKSLQLEIVRNAWHRDRRRFKRQRWMKRIGVPAAATLSAVLARQLF